MSSVEIDLREFERLQRELEKFASQAIPHAARNAVNSAAFETRKAWIGRTREVMQTRTSFVSRSIQVEKARGTRFPMEATVGSTAPLMDELESGGKHPKKGAHVAIPTVSGARGGAIGNTIRKPNRLSNIRLLDRPGATRQQRNAIAIRRAVKAKNRFALLETARGEGIFRILGRPRQLTVRMLFDLTRSDVRIPALHSLATTLHEMEPRLTELHVRAIEDQMRRHHILGY